MTDDPTSAGGNGAELDLERLGETPPASTGPRMLIPLFVVPLLIVAVVVGLFLGFSALIGGPDSAHDLLERIDRGGVNDRWQAAAALVVLVGRQGEEGALLEDQQLKDEVRSAFQNSGQRESLLRRYLAGVSAALQDREAVPMLMAALRRAHALAGSPEPGTDPDQLGAEIVHYIKHLGEIGDPQAAEAIVELAGSSDAAYRMAVAAALGDLFLAPAGSAGTAPPEVLELLLRLHQDQDAWVRMNAALSLAKVGSEEGLPTLEVMLDRDYLRRQGLQFPESGDYTVSGHDPGGAPIVSALLAIEQVVQRSGDPAAFQTRERPLVEALRRATRDDPNPVVREQAGRLLALLGVAAGAENDATAGGLRDA